MHFPEISRTRGGAHLSDEGLCWFICKGLGKWTRHAGSGVCLNLWFFFTIPSKFWDTLMSWRKFLEIQVKWFVNTHNERDILSGECLFWSCYFESGSSRISPELWWIDSAQTFGNLHQFQEDWRGKTRWLVHLQGFLKKKPVM